MWQFRVEIEHYSVEYFDCITALEADRSCSFPGTLTFGFSPMRRPYSLIHVVSLDDPDAKNKRGTAVAVAIDLTLPMMSWPYRECALALYINGERQR